MRQGAYFLIVFSGWFLVSTQISPIYVAFVLAAILLSMNLLKRKEIPKEISIEVAVVLLMYIIITQIVFADNLNNTLINVLFSIIYYIFSYCGITYLPTVTICRFTKKMINVTLPLLVVEAAYRWMNPVIFEQNILNSSEYYEYKYSSIMYEDSNYVGIYLVTLFFTCTYMKRYYNIKLQKQQFVIFTLICLTLSKASIATTIAFWIIFDINIEKWKKIVMFIIVAVIGGTYFLRQIIFDNSLGVKLMIFNYTVQWWHNAKLSSKLFGVGFGQAKYYLGIGAHNILITYFIEAGILGLLLLLVFWLVLLERTNKRGLLVMAPFFLNAMSFASHAIPYFYCILAIIIILESRQEGSYSRKSLIPFKEEQLV